MRVEERSLEDHFWLLAWPLAFLAMLWTCQGCGGGLTGSYLLTTRQGVTVTTLGEPNLEQLDRLDDIIDLTIQRWRERFATPEWIVNRFYNHLSELELVIRDSQIRVTRGSELEGQLTTGLYDGLQKGPQIQVKKLRACWGWTPLVHELTHWMLWVMGGDPQPSHPEGPIWGVGDTFVWRTTGEIVAEDCHE